MTIRRKSKRKKRAASLGGTSTARKGAGNMSGKQIGFAMLSFFGGTVLGTAVGKYSGIGGLAIGGVGAWKKNIYASSFGAGMFLSTVRPVSQGTNGIEDQEMEGFSIKNITENTKSYFQSLGQKLMLKAPSSEINGLHGDEEVNYFINPYSQRTLDTSELDRIQDGISEMNNGTSGFGDFEPGVNF